MKKLLVSTLAIAVAGACDGDGGANGNGNGSGPDGGSPDRDADTAIEFDELGLLQNVATNVVLPLYEEFDAAARDLSTAVTAYCDALAGGGAEEELAAARAAFHDAMDVWQRAELTAIGPASRDGQGLRDVIYSWPSVSACATDRSLLELRDDPENFDIAAELPNRRGLDVLEYLLFNDSIESACSTPPDGWDALSEAELANARCAYAGAAATDLEEVAGSLVDAWHPDAGDFAGDLSSAGEAGSSFATPRDAVNAVFAGLFYLEKQVKDEKLAKPLGLATNVCGAAEEGCPDELEDRYAGRGADNLAANAAGFRDVFFGIGADGEDGLGFDDFLAAAGEEQLADDIGDGLAATQNALDALPSTLREALTASYESARDIHTNVREVTTPLKTTVPETLGLEIPTEAGGDTD